MHEGRITGELSRAEATEENIMVLATHHFTDEPGDQNVSLPGTGGPHA
jgi:hypothetical protein